jgi:carboxypeptidase D
MAIQNMTWNGELGFQSQPCDPFIVDQADLVVAPQQNQTATNPPGTMGIKHHERGLMWVETFQSGHMQPQYQPRAALLHLRWLLGRIDDL